MTTRISDAIRKRLDFGLAPVKHEGDKQAFDNLNASFKAKGRYNVAPQRNPNDMPAYSMPLKDLITLWEAKFGDRWVDVSMPNDEFWTNAIDRLVVAELFEMLGSFYRIKRLD